jgi:hypothetical protein
MMRVRFATVALLASSIAGCSNGPGRWVGDPTLGSEAQPQTSIKGDLLYVSNQQSREVEAYGYTDGVVGSKVFEIGGFSMPSGLCTNKRGDVFITDSASHTIFQYRHGAVEASKLHDPDRPLDCATDPVTGDVAVANVRSIRVFSLKTRGSKVYKARRFDAFFSVAYDNSGNLFATNGASGLYELPANGSQLEQLTVDNGPLENSMGITFIDPYILVTSYSFGGVIGYKISVTGSVATVVSKIFFRGTKEAPTLASSAGNVIVPDLPHSAVRVYAANNGKFISKLKEGVDKPYSAVVSQPLPK